MKKQIFIIAHTWKSIQLTIETAYSSPKAMKIISELVGTDCHRQPLPTDNPEEYLQEYWEWYGDESNHDCEIDIALEIINL